MNSSTYSESVDRERYVLSDCLFKYGYRKLAIDVQQNTRHLDEYLTIITREAQSRQDTDVMDRLYFAGLIYG